MKKSILLIGGLTFGTIVLAQEKNVGKFEEYKPGYYQNVILRDINTYQESQKAEKTYKRFTVDLSDADLPTDPESYTQIWHNKPISQGNTGTCWCFSTTSFYESEVQRQTGKEVKLSEMYTVYWEYVERAKYFVRNRGEMTFGEGSETNAVAKIMTDYGIVPWEVYNGFKGGQIFHSHDVMFEELDNYLKQIKATNAWDEETAVKTTRAILDHYIGRVPESFKVDGKTYTPMSYLKDYVKLNPKEYVNLMSLMEKPYYEHAEYDVPDNWWNSGDYKNIPLDAFMQGVKGAIEGGYTISIGGDVSEAGFERNTQVAMIPTFDIPSDYIDESARQFRFNNKTTTDDHAMHIVGIKEHDGANWYLVKDSGSGSRGCGETCKQFGYYFFHEDYIKLKMMTATMHQDAVKEIIKKVKPMDVSSN